MSFTDFNADTIVDDRTPLEQARAKDLREIAWAFGLSCSSVATKNEVLPLLHANGIVLNRETITKTIASRDARLKAHHEATQKGHEPKKNDLAVNNVEDQPDVISMNWFSLVKLAKEHGIDADVASPKGTPKRADVLRKAITEKLNG